MKRLFIDPASVSSGWALFEGSKFLRSGTVKVPAAWPVWKRLDNIFVQYRWLFQSGEVDAVYFENVPYRPTCHVYVHYSIAVIALAVSYYTPTICVGDQGVSVKAWQKFCGWKAKSGKVLDVGPLLRKRKADSNDELAALGMGLFFLSTLEGGSFGSRKKA